MKDNLEIGKMLFFGVFYCNMEHNVIEHIICLQVPNVLNIEPIYITELTTAAYLGYITRNVKFILGSLS